MLTCCWKPPEHSLATQDFALAFTACSRARICKLLSATLRRSDLAMLHEYLPGKAA